MSRAATVSGAGGELLVHSNTGIYTCGPSPTVVATLEGVGHALMQDHEIEQVRAALGRGADDILTAAGEAFGVEPGRDSAAEAAAQDQVLARITSNVVAVIPAAAAAGITQNEPDGQVQSRAETMPWVGMLDRCQGELGQGPCVEVATPGTSTLVTVDDLAVEGPRRWPRWSPIALEAGVRAMRSVTLAPFARPAGALNVYATQPGAFDELDQFALEAFARQAAITLWGLRRAEQLTTALGSRDVIGQAKGILIERFGVTAEDAFAMLVEAFAMLVEASQRTNIKLRDVAARMARDAQPDPEHIPAVSDAAVEPAHHEVVLRVFADGHETPDTCGIDERVTGWRTGCSCGWRSSSIHPRMGLGQRQGCRSGTGIAPEELQDGPMAREWADHHHDARTTGHHPGPHHRDGRTGR